MERRHAHCEKVTWVLDNLAAPAKGAFSKASEATRARGLVRRIEFCYTPMHGIWLNIAKDELGAMTIPGLCGRRCGGLQTLRVETPPGRTPAVRASAESTGA